MPDTVLLTRAALATREDVDNGAGAVTRTADQLFARFGFQPCLLRGAAPTSRRR